ncbi:ETS domain-containing protein, partial [Endozoicomonas sp. ONNA2]|uniref:ETS domain-containing protein n=1 Tax=Endozoicomonas sp. ONNA2 TaxID=2828741 RepID=UPI0021491A92
VGQSILGQPPSGKIPGFLLEELNLPEEKRIIHWVNEECGIFRKDQSANDERARRWGVKKGNTNMTYDKLHRAIRYNYKNNHKSGSLTHLSFGIYGQSEGHKVSPFYQFDMGNKDVRGQIDYFKNNHAG